MASTFKNVGTPAIGITAVSVYTTPVSTTATVIGLSLANILTTLITVSVIVNTGADTYILKDVPIPPGSTLVPIGGDQKLVLTAGNILKVSCNTAAGLSCFISYLETV